jgi:predicted O-methyltransferase YrrM
VEPRAGTPPFRPLPSKTDTADYEPNYHTTGAFISEAHSRASELVADVDGWLREEDALKLYELAFWAAGPILEVGTYRGKSGVLMATAARDAGSSAVVLSLDTDSEAQAKAAAAARSHGVQDRLWPVLCSAAAFFAVNPGFAPSLVFLDGDHSYEGVSRDLDTLSSHLPTGGLLCLHDYFDPRNESSDCAEIDVRRAASTSALIRDCDFCGVFGASAVFQRSTGGPPHPGPGAFDLRRYDTIRMQYRQRVRTPVGRLARRLMAVSRR